MTVTEWRTIGAARGLTGAALFPQLKSRTWHLSTARSPPNPAISSPPTFSRRFHLFGEYDSIPTIASPDSLLSTDFKVTLLVHRQHRAVLL